jgi:hypothetical protein
VRLFYIYVSFGRNLKYTCDFNVGFFLVADPATTPVRGCSICPSRIFHPATGCHRGSKVLHPDSG